VEKNLPRLFKRKKSRFANNEIESEIPENEKISVVQKKDLKNKI
jgi:hypothetical protein